MILKEFTVGPLQVRAYVIGCPETRACIIVDPAGSEEMLARVIQEEGLKLKAIVNTHGHPDHTCGNQRMKELTGAPVLMHQDDDELFRRPDIVAMFIAWGFEAAPPADGHLKPGERLEVGKLAFEIIHTPGHSPGSVCLYGHGYLVTGDTLFIDGVGRTDLPGGSYETLKQSIQEKILPLPDDTVVLPGHDYGPKPVDTLGNQKRSNPFLS